MSDNYEDIINHMHHVSRKHPQMPAMSRAAQFAPFSALNGHSSALEETVCRHAENNETIRYDADWDGENPCTEKVNAPNDTKL